jgi:hypothetical protein
MTLVRERRLLLTSLAVFAAVALFACGGQTTPQQPAQARISPASPQEPPRPTHQPAVAGFAPAAPAIESPVETDQQTEPTGAESAEPGVPPGEVARTQPRREGSGEQVFSNKDLASYKKVKEQFGFRDDVVMVDVTKKGPGEKQDTESDKMGRLTAEARAEQFEQTRREITTLNAELEYLKKRVPSLHNPFLPRAALNEADQTAEAGMDNARRLQHVNERIGDTTRRLGELQQRLAELYNSKPPETDAEAPQD